MCGIMQKKVDKYSDDLTDDLINGFPWLFDCQQFLIS